MKKTQSNTTETDPSTFKNLINYKGSSTSKWGINVLGQLAIGKKIKLNSHSITIYYKIYARWIEELI